MSYADSLDCVGVFGVDIDHVGKVFSELSVAWNTDYQYIVCRHHRAIRQSRPIRGDIRNKSGSARRMRTAYL